MKPRLPFFPTRMLLLSCIASLPSFAKDVSSWEELKDFFSSGESSLKLTADIIVPATYDERHLAGINVEERYYLSIDGSSPDGTLFRFTGTGGDTVAYGTGSRAFYGTGEMSFSFCHFDRNYVAFDVASLEAKGGAVYAPGVKYLFMEGGLFTGNHVLVAPSVASGIAEGGAVYATKGVFRNTVFEGNYVGAASGAYGGAISCEGNIFLEDCRFLGNYALKAADDSSFGSSFGGGLYYHVKAGDPGKLELVARESDFVFRGNAQNATLGEDGGLADGVANAVYIKSDKMSGRGEVRFGAAAGKSLLFYDPVFFAANPGAAKVDVHFNKSDEPGSRYSGRIVFSGEDYLQPGREESRISYCSDNVSITQYDGEVIIRNGAVLGLSAGEYGKTPGGSQDIIGMDRFTMRKGILDISSMGRLLAGTISVTGGVNDCTWRTGGGARMDAGLLDLSQGVTIDFRPYVNTGDSGLLISADSVLMGGNLRIEDKYNSMGLESLDFYMDSRWASRQKYLIFDFADPAGIQGDFGRVVSRLSGKDEVDSPYGYQGKWKEVWEDSNGDAAKDKLYLVWMPAGSEPESPDEPGYPDNPNPQPPVYPGIREIHPEMAGALVMNSLWSSVAGLRAFNQITLDRLDVPRFQSESEETFWAAGMSSFEKVKSADGMDGYDYEGNGFSVGADIPMGSENRVAGVAYCYLTGKNRSRNYASEIDMDARCVMLYYGWKKELSSMDLLKIYSSFAYGMTDNDQETYYSDGLCSSGVYDVNAGRFTLRGEWEHTLDAHWMLSASAGLEYDSASRSDFQETGDRVRSFEKADMANLAMPLGMAIHREDDYGDGMKWRHRLALNLVPDIYRKDPEGAAVLVENGFAWTARGIERDRFAFRLEYATRLQIDAHWSIFAGYSLEGRKDTFYQMFNAGINIAL